MHLMHPMHFLGRSLARFLAKPAAAAAHPATCTPGMLASVLRKGDVLLVEGDSRFSVAVKYLTQSSWSHATFCIGDALGVPKPGEEVRVLVEADIEYGVRAVPLSAYAHFHTRICRPVGLREDEIDRLVGLVTERLGQQYDLKNVIDLARYLFRPPVPHRWKRRLLALGSGDPTRAICSTLIAGAFQRLPYPILPEIYACEPSDRAQRENYRELLHIRHYSLYTPRDFDVSPYFRIIKPTLEHFDPHRLVWASQQAKPHADQNAQVATSGAPTASFLLNTSRH